MDSMGTMRDLEQIRETDESDGSSRLMSLALGGLATACVLFAIGVMVGREAGESQSATREDPLARLDQLARQPEGAPTPVTYPERLTGPAPIAANVAAPAPAAPPVPLLAGATPSPSLAGAGAGAGAAVLVGGATPPSSMSIRLSPTAAGASPMAPGATLGPAAPGAPAPAGSDGAFSVQVSSFRSAASAQAFAQRLRERGHHAFVAQPATAPNGVVWHRVRIGPFVSQHEASAYRGSFEARERMPTIVVRRDAPDGHAAVASH